MKFLHMPKEINGSSHWVLSRWSFIQLGPTFSTPLSSPGLPACTCMWTPPCWGTSVTIPHQNYKYSSRHHFHYSQVNWWSSLTCQRSLMAQVTGYYHVGSQEGRDPTQVRVGWPDSKGDVGGARPSWTQIWFRSGPTYILGFIGGKNNITWLLGYIPWDHVSNEHVPPLHKKLCKYNANDCSHGVHFQVSITNTN